MKRTAWYRPFLTRFAFFPFRLNFFLLCLWIGVGKMYLLSPQKGGKSFAGMINLMAKISLHFCLLMVGFCLLSAGLCYLIFWYRTKQQPEKTLQVEMKANTDGILQLRSTLPFALKPWLGFVKIRYRYDESQYTSLLLLHQSARPSIINIGNGVSGAHELQLPDIREYPFLSAQIVFEDLLRFFSFRLEVPVQGRIFHLPHTLHDDEISAIPKQTEEETVRIDQLRKVDGEYLHYKKFESSDDVRRIVWKIYAKQKELVVRIPEIVDPFASHVEMFASFYITASAFHETPFSRAMLNYYKNAVWTIFEGLQKQEFVLTYRSDQDRTLAETDDKETAYQIASSDWQNNASLKQYFKPKTGSVLCIHSFSPIDDVKQIAELADEQTLIVFVSLSSVFKKRKILHFLIRLFVKPVNTHLARLQDKWFLHPMRLQVLRNEAQIELILQHTQANVEKIS